MNAQHFEIFLQALNKKLIVEAKINTKSKGEIIRKLVPLDFEAGSTEQEPRYHFFTLNSPNKNHYMSIEEQQLMEIKSTKQKFQAKKYQDKRNAWSIPRNWAEREIPKQ